MLIKIPKSWSLKESDATPQSIYKERRKFMKGTAAAITGGIAGSLIGPEAFAAWVRGEKLPHMVNEKYLLDQEQLTKFDDVIQYNNFYEFGTGKGDPVENAKDFQTKPWTIEIAGEVANPGTYDVEDLLKPHKTEQRVYRHRCVETWSMVVPWLGVPLADIIKRLEPTSRAKYVAFETLYDPKRMPGQNRRVLQWPYVEGLRLDEAMNPLTFMATGVYDEIMPPQNGAPIRLIVPWKYGFKGIKSIVKITFTEDEPPTSWNRSAPHEYGFYANVNPDVSHPRWSQAKERRIGSFFKQPTAKFNGYGEEVASLYTGMDLAKFY
ncbi:protein-methionine-sulfoxide reductase catalytic subunit MsrP [Magnetovibrio sp. PR-2]|uniref:protein-methionine-sulfoxide reductase catalytic subunit MsrP n=1 Tax=Magnetovibrio sp. PR-2 TaxID=3120356 RepID=UPI002FCE011E